MMSPNTVISTSVLKGKAIYGDLLLKQGYEHYQVDDLAVTEFLGYERDQLGEPSSLYLLAVKKILLYATPVISPIDSASKRGVTLTAQFTTNCIVRNSSDPLRRLATGDKYTLIGFAFPAQLVNHLDFSTFEWKYYQLYPAEYTPTALSLRHLDGIETVHDSTAGPLFMIKSTHYEDADLYNNILSLLKSKLNEYVRIWTSVLDRVNDERRGESIKFSEPTRLAPLNDKQTIHQLNAYLERQIDPTYSASYYETLHVTGNWLLYNLIVLYGYDSPVVNEYLTRLMYVKSENAKVRIQLAADAQVQLLRSRGEKIAREQYPFYFSPIDRRGIFSKFKRFDVTKLPNAHQQEISILVQKELAHQDALVHNQCPHMPIVRQLGEAQSSAISLVQVYVELYPFIDFGRKSADDHIYHCKNCGYELMCEHEVDLYSEIQLNKTDSTISGNDVLYEARHIIIDRYKQTQIGVEHSDMFSYHCRHCAKELGKSDDIIQVGRKDIVHGQQITLGHDLYKNMTFLIMNSVLTSNVDPIVLGIDKRRALRALVPTIRDHLETVAHAFKKLNNDDLIEAHTRLSTLILCLCSLISLNINVLKTNKQLLVADQKGHKIMKSNPKPTKSTDNSEAIPVDESSDESGDDSRDTSTDESSDESGDDSRDTSTDESSDESGDDSALEQPAVTGGSIKTEFAAAFMIVKQSMAFKSVTTSDDKLKAMLMDYYRQIAKDIGNGVDISAVTRTNEDRLTNEIAQGPVYAYLQYMLARNERKVLSTGPHAKGQALWKRPFDQVMGINITKGFEGNLYRHIPSDNTKPTTNQGKYIHESYENLQLFLVSDKYKGTDVEPEPSAFVQQYEASEQERIYNLTHNPHHRFDEVNSREVSFSLTNLNLIYCNGQHTPTKHQWIKDKCSICGIALKQASSSHNSAIDKLLDEASARAALFDLYTNSCPVKDIHVYTDEHVGLHSQCSQCGATQKQLMDHDSAYYKRYLPQFEAHHRAQIAFATAEIKSLTTIGEYTADTSRVLDSIDTSNLEASSNQMLLTISKVLDVPTSAMEELSPLYIDSYIRLIYERYTYASNLSYDMVKHPDAEFYAFIKSTFFTNAKPIRISMASLPDYDYRNYSLVLKSYHLITLLWTIAQDSNQSVLELGKYLVRKIVAQEARRKEFNFAKLKAIAATVEDMEVDTVENPDEIDEEEDMFMSYDIDMDDMEDNLNGEHD